MRKQIHSLAFGHQLRNTKHSRVAMDVIQAGYRTPPNREDSEQVADLEQCEKGAEDECEASEEECDEDGDEDASEEEEAGRKR